jgi:uncharacterized membrane protein YhaH (DUF805 family)
MFHFLFSFRGRVNLAKFWMYYLGSCFCLGAFMFGIIALEQLLHGTTLLTQFCIGLFFCWPQTWPERLLVIIADVVLVVFFYSMLAVVVKRLHDRGRSAWWLAFFYGVPLGSFILLKSIGYTPLNTSPEQQMIHLAVFVVCSVIIWWYLIEILFIPGKRGDNRFGPDPRRIDGPKGAA